MAPFATPADIVAVWRPLTEGETSAAEVLLDVASDKIRDRFVDIDARLAAGTIRPSIVRQAAVQMVRRYLDARGPGDPIQKATGPFTKTWAKGEGGALTFTAEELEDLTARRTSRRHRAIPMDFGLGTP